MNVPSAQLRTLDFRFQLQRLLKEADGISTWLGTDLSRDEEVVIKIADASSVSPDTLIRLQHEADVLRSIAHPSLAAIVHVGRAASAIYLVIRHVPGVTLRERLDRGPLSVAEVLTVATALFSALEAVHERGILHRDVKPTNVIVNAEGPLQSVVLIDFGLARSTRLHASVRDLPVGTALYTSPEQAGVLNCEVSERSDLYSAAILLFEALCGEPPFQGSVMGEVLRKHASETPPTLQSRGVAAPAALEALVARLLRKDPRDRYQSARAVTHDLRGIAQALARGVDDPDMVLGLQDVRRTLTEPTLVGRHREMQQLLDRLEQTRGGRGRLVLVEAPSGGGKTRLLEETARRTPLSRTWLLRGQAQGNFVRLPLQTLEGVVADLIGAMRSDEESARRVIARLEGTREDVAAALPQLAALLNVHSANDVGLEQHGEVRTLRALVSLLDSLGTSARPALVLLDDCQWADELTIKLLAAWQTHAREHGSHTLLVVAFRSEEIGPEHALRMVGPSLCLQLAPLADEELRTLVESAAGPVPQEVHEVISRLSEGSPFMASAVLRGLVEAGALSDTQDGWRVDEEALRDVQSSRRAAVLLARRLDYLPPGCREVLGVAAVLGRGFELSMLAEVCKQDVESVRQQLVHAHEHHFVWTHATTPMHYTFVHDKLRESLLAALSDGTRQAVHAAAAQILKNRDESQVYALAYHFHQAGQIRQALPYALKAAQQARARHALEIAEQQYRIAEEGAADADSATRRIIAEGLGDVLMLRGNYREATAQLEGARAFVCDRTSQARLEGKLGELAFKQGDTRTASDAISRGLELLGHKVPRKFASFLGKLGWQAVIQVCHTWLPSLFVRTRDIVGAEEDLLAVRLYSRLAYTFYFNLGAIPTMWAHLHELNLAEKYPPTRELGQACSNHAVGMSMLPNFRRAEAYGKRGLSVRRALDDTWGQGQALHFLGVGLLAASRFREALEKFQEAVKVLERTGDRWEVNAARYHTAFALYRLGDLRSAIAISRDVYQAGCLIGDYLACGIALNVWSKASAGQVPEALLRDELMHLSDDVHRTSELLVAEGVRLMACDRARDAVEKIQQAWDGVRRAGLRTEYVAGVPGWLATALRSAAQSLPADATAEYRRLMARAWDAAHVAVRVARSFRNSLPHALRELAILSAARGRHGRARKLFDQSLAVAQSQEANYEYAQTLLARGQAGLILSWPGAAAQVATATRHLDDMRGVSPAPAPISAPLEETLSLADRFATLLVCGRQLASSLSLEDVFAAVREAAAMLLRPEQCLIVQLGDDGKPSEKMDVDGAAGPSRTLLEQAVQSGRPVVFEEGRADRLSESILFADVRSCMCVPILVRGRAVACFYVTHRSIGGLFGEVERQLAEFIAVLAGTALENSEGFAEVQALSESLTASNLELDQSLRELRETQQRLIQSEKMAMAGQLAGGVAHDFNNLLTVISGYTELGLMSTRDVIAASRAERDNSITECLDEISKAGQRGMALTRQLLTFSRRKVIEPQVVDLNQVVAGVSRMLERIIREDIELKTVLPPHPVSALADPTELEQVIMNLAVNARDAMPSGGRLVIETAAVELMRETGGPTGTVPPGRYVMLRAIDTGCGMDAQTLSHIFEPFFTTKEVGKGTGLGLATVYGIVHRSKGALEVSSVLGRGTTFTIYLPQVDASTESVSATAARTRVTNGHETILLVEDADGVRGLASRILRLSGYTVLEARGGEEALRVEQKHTDPIDLVVSDVVMPGISGPETVTRLRSRRPGLKVVYMSGYPDHELFEKGLVDVKSSWYVEKPFTADALTRKVRQALMERAVGE